MLVSVQDYRSAEGTAATVQWRGDSGPSMLKNSIKQKETSLVYCYRARERKVGMGIREELNRMICLSIAENLKGLKG